MNREERIAELAERREEVANRTERLWAKNEFRDFPVYRVPTDLLILNPTNQRFRPDRQEIEAQLERSLDPLTNPEDEASIISLLLDRDWRIEGDHVVGTPSNDTRALVSDWERRKQESPFWLRPDGIVRNGNRRLAMLKRLQDEHGREGYDWVDAIFLDHETFDDDDLFDMEALEQLTEGLKVRYADLALLLTLRDAANREGVDWHDPESISAAASRIQHLVGSDPRYAQLQLWAVKYMTDYLEHIDKAGEYHRLKGQVERFRSLGQNMMWVRREAPEREVEMLEACFAAVSAGLKHLDIREIRTMLSLDPERFDELVEEIREVEDEDVAADETEEAPEPKDVDVSADEDGEEDEEPADGGSPDPAYPVQSARRVIALRVQASRDARAVRDIQGDVRLAAERLQRIDPAQLPTLLDGRQGSRLRAAIDTIIEWAEGARTSLADDSASGDTK